MEELCSNVQPSRPRILLNDSPLDMSINKTLFEGLNEDVVISKCHMSLPDLFDPMAKHPDFPKWTANGNQSDSLNMPTPTKIKMKDVCTDLRNISLFELNSVNNVSHISQFDCDTDNGSSAYFSGRSSSMIWKSNNESIGARTGSEDLFFLAGKFIATDSETSAYQSGQMSDVDSMSSSYKAQLCDTLDVCKYRRDNWSSPTCATSTGTGSNGFITSSPIHLNGSDVAAAAAITINDDSDTDDFNDTIERVNYLLARCTTKPLSPAKWARRKQLLQEYAYEIIRQESGTKLRDSFSCNDLSTPVNTNVAKDIIIKASSSNINATASHSSTAYDPFNLVRIKNELKAIECTESTTPYDEVRRQYILEQLAMNRTPSRKTLKRSISVDQFI